MLKNPAIVSVILLLSGLLACTGAPEQTQAEQALADSAESEAAPSTDSPPPEAGAETSAMPQVEQEEFKSEPVAVEPPPPPEPERATVPAGTVLGVRLAEPISTRTNKAGDNLIALLDQDLLVDGRVVFPEGTKAFGTLLAVEGSGRVEGRAEMTITLTELRLGDQAYPIKTGNITIQAEGTQGRDAKVIGGAAGVGALVGGIIGGKKGAAVGAAVGGGAGTATVLTTKGKEVEFQPEHRFSFNLSRDIEATLP